MLVFHVGACLSSLVLSFVISRAVRDSFQSVSEVSTMLRGVIQKLSWLLLLRSTSHRRTIYRASLYLIGLLLSNLVSHSALADGTDVEKSRAVKVPLIVIDEQAYALPARINNEYDILLLLDTGASETIFNASALKKRGFAIQKTRKRRQGLFRSGRVGLVQFDSLEVGGVTVGEYTATTANYKIDYDYWERRALPVTEGLLGFDILHRLKAVIDFADNMPLFSYPLDTSLSPRQRLTLSIDRGGGFTGTWERQLDSDKFRAGPINAV